jgi:hypothetical protein
LTSVTVFQPLQGDPELLDAAFAADPGSWLPDATPAGDGWRATVHAGALSQTVDVTVGQRWRAGSTSWRTVSWTPVPEHPERRSLHRVLPVLDGELALHVAGPRTTLALEARYQPPGGALGAAADAVALHRVARSTVERLLADVARLLADAAQTTPRDEELRTPSS